MKSYQRLIACIIIAACALLPACANQTPGKPKFDAAKVAKIGNLVLTVAENRGAIDKKEAALVRTTGVLVLNAASGDTPVADISKAAVAEAVKRGAITPEESELLHQVGTIILKPTVVPEAVPGVVP